MRSPSIRRWRGVGLVMAAALVVTACGGGDAPEVFEAIERANPYASSVRSRFFTLASELNAKLADGAIQVQSTLPAEIQPATPLTVAVS
jgi:hypothetical protein